MQSKGLSRVFSNTTVQKPQFFGAIYPTTTKVKTVLTSVDTLRDICNAVPIPANAIGGLNKDNIDVLAGVPVAGVCVVSAIMKADDPMQAATQLKARAKGLGLC